MRSDAPFEGEFDDIDDEFDSIVAGFEADSVPVVEPGEARKGEAELTAGSPSASADDVVLEQVREEPVGVASQMIGLVLLPVGPAQAVAQLLAMYSIARWVVPIGQHTAVWLELEADGDEEFNALLGDERGLPPECDRFARVLSRMTRLGSVAMVSTLHEFDGQPQGDVLGRRYVSGEPEATIPAGLLLNTLDARAEDLLLGRVHPRDLPDAIHPEQRPEGKRGFGRPFRFGR